MSIQLSHDLDKLSRIFSGEKIEKARNIAANKTANKARTAVSTAIREQYSVLARDVSKTVKLRKGDQIGERVLLYTGARIGLDKFSPKVVLNKARSDRKASSISVKIKKKGPRKVLKGRRGFGAFMADLNGEKIFMRKTRNRLPIRRLTTISVPDMVLHNSVLTAFEKTVEKEYPIQIERALDYQLGFHR